eukprot:544868-Amphidinium_carterae.1
MPQCTYAFQCMFHSLSLLQNCMHITPTESHTCHRWPSGCPVACQTMICKTIKDGYTKPRA